MATTYKLKDFAQLYGKDIFVDANVLIYLFWPTGQYSYESDYARVFRNLLRQGNNLYVNFLIISEVVNRILKIEFQKLKSNSNQSFKFKDFRNSEVGRDVINDIYLIVQTEILSRFEIIDKTFNKNDIEGFLMVDQLDFVDKATVSICSENNLVLLTNDRDFKNSGLDILTGNPRILN